MTIRVASTADARAVNEIYAYYYEHTLCSFNESNKSDDERAHEIETLLERYPFLIAEGEDGACLGFACGEPYRAQTGYRFTVELTIYLHPSAPKGQGIGTALYAELLRMLTEQGYYTAYGVLFSENEASIRLHRHFGFEKLALLPHTAFKHGRWVDALIMQKVLKSREDAANEPIFFSEYRKRL